MFAVPKTMRAAVYRGVNEVRVETVPVPRIGARELLVKVAVCGVCPTDIKKIQYGTVAPPRIFGHETAGVVVRVGARVKRFQPGDRVALHHHVPCLRCHYCRHRCFAQCETYRRTGITAGFEPAGGGFAEYVRVMDFVLPGVVKIPPQNSFEEGALLEPTNTVLKAVKRLNLLRGDTVLVAGQGPIGLMFTKILHLRGVNVVASDLFPARLKLAKQFGARWTQPVSNPESGEKPLAGRAVLDAVIVTVPSDALVEQALQWVRAGGQVLLFAHTKRKTPAGGQRPEAGGEAVASLDLASICLDEKDLIGSYSSDFTLQEEAARLVFSRRLDVRPLITHRFTLEQAPAALQLASRPAPDSLKIVVTADGQGL
ncbi:MAG TPA: alcohol dehydrogenase catalytic domain-containing protein [Verrucomicrobiae bacterium]|nr:alcohol dehydrogenase catalytic domain-containing protein [Verrucomicrobiae bacterium]